MNVYAEQWQSAIPDLVKIPKDRPIVTYCGGGDECELSRDLAKSLRTFGFKSVVVYTGGIKDWTAKKYPTAAGEQ
jgi:rhodanese-related sulfurtransferase